jgi:hypothetical protein
MNDLEKAARQALEALSRSKLMDDNHFYCYAAATALSQALEQAEKKPCNPSCAPGYCYCKEMTEQPKQKPVAWWNPKKDTVSCDPVHRHHPDCVPLYTVPPQREWDSLTEEEISAIAKKLFGAPYDAGANRSFARAIEAKLKEKNV